MGCRSNSIGRLICRWRPIQNRHNGTNEWINKAGVSYCPYWRLIVKSLLFLPFSILSLSVELTSWVPSLFLLQRPSKHSLGKHHHFFFLTASSTRYLHMQSIFEEYVLKISHHHIWTLNILHLLFLRGWFCRLLCFLVTMMASLKERLAGPGYVILNGIRVINIVSFLDIIAASAVMLVKISLLNSFFFFEAVTHAVTAGVSSKCDLV